MQELKKYGIPATPSLRRAINERAVVAEQKILCHVRALFDYHPYDDQLMPCPEAGLAFQFGDVLAILNQARCSGIQGGWSVCRTGNGEKLSCSQAHLGQATGLAVA